MFSPLLWSFTSFHGRADVQKWNDVIDDNICNFHHAAQAYWQLHLSGSYIISSKQDFLWFLNHTKVQQSNQNTLIISCQLSPAARVVAATVPAVNATTVPVEAAVPTFLVACCTAALWATPSSREILSVNSFAPWLPAASLCINQRKEVGLQSVISDCFMYQI